MRRFWNDSGGASAVEFALVMIPMIIMVLGTINLSVLLYANATLAYAAEDAARCMSVKKQAGVCDTAANTQTYARGRYKGPGVSPTFVASTTTCGSGAGSAAGSKVTGTATYRLSMGIGQISVPLSATACYPS